MICYLAVEFSYDHECPIGIFSSKEHAINGIEMYITKQEWDTDVQYMSYGVYSIEGGKIADNTGYWDFETIYEDDGECYPKLRGKVGDKDYWINRMDEDE